MAVRTGVIGLALALALVAQDGAVAQTGPTVNPSPAASVPHAHRTIRATEEAQREFDSALAYLWAFSIGEARLRFARAAQRDPACAMCRWGEALAETTDINLAHTDEGDRLGALAIADARRRVTADDGDDRQLIDALALRFAPKRSIDERFGDFAAAMERYADRHPDDATGLDVAAYARWNATSSLLDDRQHPTAAALRIERYADRALAIDPDDLGAHHLRIHLEEWLERNALALPNARYLDGLTYPPGMSHLPHMAGHTFARLGMFDATVTANRRALENDAAYDALGDGPGQKYIERYHAHDEEFVAYGLTATGRAEEARTAAASFTPYLRARVLLRDGEAAGAAEVIAGTPTPGAAAIRAIALARMGRLADARALERRFLVAPPPSADLARAAIARAAGDAAAERDALTRARATTFGYPGDPRTAWFMPPGEALGAALLRAGRAAEAERMFRDELARFPGDPRLAFGLAEALHAQGKDDAAPRAEATRAWHGERPLRRDDLA